MYKPPKIALKKQALGALSKGKGLEQERAASKGESGPSKRGSPRGRGAGGRGKRGGGRGGAAARDRGGKVVALPDGYKEEPKKYVPRKKPIRVEAFDPSLLTRYRKALDTALKIATSHNVKPIKGRTLIIMNQLGNYERQKKSEYFFIQDITLRIEIYFFLFVQVEMEHKSQYKSSKKKCDH